MKINFANLDFIRTTAVLAVVIRHILGELNIETIGPFRVQLLGIFGVMLFFVLTSHVLMLSLERLEANQGQRAVWSFYVQRVFRIYPLSAVIVTTSWLVTSYGEVPGFHRLTTSQLLSNLFLVQNLTDSPNAIGPLWSLPLEVQMYIFLPMAYLLLRKSRRAIGGIYVGAAVLGLASFKIALPEVFRYFPCFVPGAIAFGVLTHLSPRKILPFLAMPAVLACAGVIYSILGLWSQTVGAYPACLLVGLAIPFIRQSRSPHLNAFCGFVSKYSYGIYLVHAPILAIIFTLSLPLAAKLSVFVLTTTLASVIAYRYIEAPMIAMGKAMHPGKAGNDAGKRVN